VADGEKGLAWRGQDLDILRGHQFAPEYQKVNPRAVVPTLVHDSNVIVESTVINEYLDETFPDVPLKPKSSVERAEMRVWTKAVDENLHPACGEITFASCHRHIVRRLRDYRTRRAQCADRCPLNMSSGGCRERGSARQRRGQQEPQAWYIPPAPQDRRSNDSRRPNMPWPWFPLIINPLPASVRRSANSAAQMSEGQPL